MAEKPISKAEARAAKAAEMRAAQQKRERNRRLLTIGGVLLVIVAIVVGSVVISQLSDDPATAGDSEYGVAIGPEDAPHEIVIYEDFLCPFCGELERESAKELARLAEEGKVRVEYRPFELLSQIGDYSMRATNAFAVVLEEEGEEVAKAYHDLLFENQPPEDPDQFLSDDELVDLAVEAGADEDAVRGGIEGLEQEDWVDDATAAAKEAGVSGTPTVVLDGDEVQGFSSIDDLVNQLVEAVQ
ncbi:protein-disulfide isomerase [Nocardioides thalensis]|uniref:Protein-disulfide isomerase n=1 Tax=Nocardioides thalensis TaxID=1914755 RepID=A0A853BZH4_9ACTN|nr:thioredoxin domain-containing protein [Nocardioides thalensis]NYJ00434.1 protein-disulfide isomerase [Nocardioides thalensis]